MEGDIEKIRNDVIAEIKEKVRKNPRYLHPANKERQEDMKRLKFANGYDFTCWMQQNEIMKNPIDVKRKEREKTIKNAGCNTIKECLDKCAQKAGFKNRARYRDRQREYRHETGRCLPKEFNEDCSSWFGDFVEDLMIHRYLGAIKMPPGNPEFDYLWNGIKIDSKGRCLERIDNWFGWAFNIWMG